MILSLSHSCLSTRDWPPPNWYWQNCISSFTLCGIHHFIVVHVIHVHKWHHICPAVFRSGAGFWVYSRFVTHTCQPACSSCSRQWLPKPGWHRSKEEERHTKWSFHRLQSYHRALARVCNIEMYQGSMFRQQKLCCQPANPSPMHHCLKFWNVE